MAILRGLRGAYEDHHDVRDRRRGARGRGAAVGPLHQRVPPARQGDRPGRPGRRPAAAAGGAGARRRRASARSSSSSRPRRRPRSPPRPTRTPAASRSGSTRRASALESLGESADPARPTRRRGRDRRGRRGAHRHPGGRAGRRRAGAPERASRTTCTSRVIGQEQRRRGRRGHDPPRPRRAVRGRPAAGHASCSSARPASARPSSSRRCRSGCSRPRRRWSGSTCPSTASRTRSRG